MKCIAVELDGTLSKTTSDGSIGAPVQAMLDRVKAWTEDGLVVVLFTARAGNDHEIKRIRSWLGQYGLPNDLEITNIKGEDMVEIWDSKSIRVEVDTGDVCKTCNSTRKKTGSISAKHSVRDDFKTDC